MADDGSVEESYVLGMVVSLGALCNVPADAALLQYT